MNQDKSNLPNQPVSVPAENQHAPKKSISISLIVFGVLGSFAFTVVVYLVLWALLWSDVGSSLIMNDAFYLALYLGIILGPGIIAALIILLMLRKK